MLNPSDIAQFKAQLEKEAAQLEKELAELNKVPNMGGGEIDAFDSEADEAEEFSQNQGAVQALKPRHIEIREALARIEAGTYGKCLHCGKEISKELLTVNPESAYCADCNKKK